MEDNGNHGGTTTKGTHREVKKRQHVPKRSQHRDDNGGQGDVSTTGGNGRGISTKKRRKGPRRWFTKGIQQKPTRYQQIERQWEPRRCQHKEKTTGPMICQHNWQTTGTKE